MVLQKKKKKKKNLALYIHKEQIVGPENYYDIRKSSGHISWIRQLAFKILTRENDTFLKIYTLYIQKEEIFGPENDHTMRKSPANISWVRAFSLILYKEDPPNLYKIESAYESDNASRIWYFFFLFF
jgi:hypothetical protein